MYERIETLDGSVTYRNTEVGATYRSVHGAETESRYVFLEGTRLPERAETWRVLELGFGTGLNFATTLKAAAELGVSLEYVSLEPSPMPAENWLLEPRWKQIELGRRLEFEGAALTIVPKRWQEFEPSASFFHACYHDPFGPGVCPDCWTAECFGWSYRALTDEGVLATFGAAGATRRAMKETGYFVARLPGVKPKREMTVAGKSEAAVAHGKPWKRDS